MSEQFSGTMTTQKNIAKGYDTNWTFFQTIEHWLFTSNYRCRHTGVPYNTACG